MAFQCLTGYYAIIAYSDVLLQEYFGEGTDQSINARQGVFLIAAFNLLGSIASIALITKFGRRPIFLFGQGGIALSLVCIAAVSAMN